MAASENRKRRNQVLIRLSDEELDRLEKKAVTVGLSVNAFLRELALKQKVSSPRIDKAGAQAMWAELRRIGVNLNQLTRLAHEGAVIIELDELEALRKGVDALRQRLSSEILGRPTGSSTTATKEPSSEAE